MLVVNPRVALLVTQTKEPRKNNPLVSSVPAAASVPWVVPTLIPRGLNIASGVGLWSLQHRLAAEKPDAHTMAYVFLTTASDQGDKSTL